MQITLDHHDSYSFPTHLIFRYYPPLNLEKKTNFVLFSKKFNGKSKETVFLSQSLGTGLFTLSISFPLSGTI
jgi:hypothetical protein